MSVLLALLVWRQDAATTAVGTTALHILRSPIQLTINNQPLTIYAFAASPSFLTSFLTIVPSFNVLRMRLGPVIIS